MRNRIIQIASIVMLLLITATEPSYAQPSEIWRETHDFSIGAPPNLYPARDVGLEIGTDAGGNVYIAVSTAQWLDRTADNPVEYYVFKYDPDGNRLWHSGVGNGSFVDFHVDPSGNVYCAYSSYYLSGTTGQDANIIKINSDGSSGWSKTWNNTTVNQADWPIAITVDGGGNVYFLIKSDFNPSTMYSNYAPVILKYDPAGNLIWEETGSTAYPNPKDIALDTAGNAYVLLDGLVSKYSWAGGTLMCSELVQYWWDDDGLDTNPKYWADADGVDIEVGSDGNVYIAGSAEQRHWFWTGSDWDYEHHLNFYMAKYDSGCNLIWRDEYGTYEEEEYPKELVFDNDGNIFVTGPSAYQLATLKYLPDGTRAATYRYSIDNAPGFYIDGMHAYVIEIDEYSSPYRALRKYLLSTAAELWTLPLDDLLTVTDVIIRPGDIFYISGSVDDGEEHQPPTVPYRNDMVIIKYTQLEDVDGDTIPNIYDNCLLVPNVDQSDFDSDNVGDACDNCVYDSNTDQEDRDEDNVGDVCDNCLWAVNTDQADTDSDTVGNVCDNCPDDSNVDQTDRDNDGVGDVCDNSPDDYNPDQLDTDNDGEGDASDPDDDNDGILDGLDNCSIIYNPGQQDTDSDGIGDACNDGIDSDGDEWADSIDNCPNEYNRDQSDINNDGIGNACAVDLSIGPWEVTQAIQTRNLDVHLIKGKPTWLRLYVNIGAVPDTVTVSGVTGKLIGWHPDGSTSEVTPDPLVITASNDPDRGQLSDTLNFRLPDEWLNPHDDSMLFTIVVNPDRTVWETNYTNNSIIAGTHRFQERSPLNLMIVPVKVNNCTPSLSDVAESLEYVAEVFPIGVINDRMSYILEYDQDPTCHNHDMLWEIWKRNFATNDPLSRMHYYGVVCADSVINGACSTAGTGGTAFFNSEEAWGMIDDLPSPIGARMAHELGHNFGRDHVPDSTCPAPDADSNYPQYTDENGNNLSRSSIGEFGFDGTNLYDPSTNFDFMSYCAPEWVSPYTYEGLFSEFPTYFGSESMESDIVLQSTDQEYLIASGILKTDDTVELDPFQIVMLPTGSDDDPGVGSYSIELQNVSGDVLFVRYFDPRHTSPTANSKIFTERVPYHTDTVMIILKHNEQLLKTVVVSANQPQVTVTFPNGAETLTGLQTITWTATDEDSTILTYDVLYSQDGGNMWTALSIGVNTNSYVWDTGRSPGSSQGLIRIWARDGVNSGYDDSNSTFTVAKKTPEVIILTPADNSSHFLNTLITFKGRGFDFEDGSVADNSLIWTSDRDGSIGSGREIFLKTLSAGQHTITLSAEDSDANVGTASINITVSGVDDRDGDGIGDDIDNCPLSSNPDQNDTDTDGQGDVCDDDDTDNDGFPDNIDNCRLTPNDQKDTDKDGLGNICDHECEADFDLDQDVDNPDLAHFASQIGRTDCGSGALYCNSDFDGDGDVDGIDLTMVIADFGRVDCPILVKKCSGVLSYDTGTPGWHYGVNAGNGIAVRFTPPSYPWTFDQVTFWPWSSSQSLDFEIHVWDDDGPGEMPGSDLITPFIHNSSKTDQWESVDIPSITILEGEFFIGWIQVGNQLFYNGSDDAATSQGRSFIKGSDGLWKNFLDLPNNDNMMIRQGCK